MPTRKTPEYHELRCTRQSEILGQHLFNIGGISYNHSRSRESESTSAATFENMPNRPFDAPMRIPGAHQHFTIPLNSVYTPAQRRQTTGFELLFWNQSQR